MLHYLVGVGFWCSDHLPHLSHGQAGRRNFQVANHKRASNWGEHKFMEVSLPLTNAAAVYSFLVASLGAGEEPSQTIATGVVFKAFTPW